MGNCLKVYLAGPDVFLPDVVAVGNRKKDLCRQFGFEGLFPFDAQVDFTQAPKIVAADIYRENMTLIRQADFGIFNLTPFRGLSADVGTVFELGAFVGLQKPVFAYTNSADAMAVRAEKAGLVVRDEPGRGPIDREDLTIENFDNADNLMIDCSIDASGAFFHRLASADPLRDLRGFIACLEDARRSLSLTPAKLRA